MEIRLTLWNKKYLQMTVYVNHNCLSSFHYFEYDPVLVLRLIPEFIGITENQFQVAETAGNAA